MNNLLKCELVMLPANQNSGDLRLYNNKLGYKHNPHSHNGNYIDKPQHLYITSDRPIKDGDYITDGEGVYQFNNVNARRFLNKGGYKKIEATTNPELKEITAVEFGTDYKEYSSIPQIPESFIQAYIKNYNLGKPIKETYIETTYKGDEQWFGEDNNAIKVRSEGNKAGCVLCHQIKENFTRTEVEGVLEACLQRLVKQANLAKITDNDSVKKWFNKNY